MSATYGRGRTRGRGGNAAKNSHNSSSPSSAVKKRTSKSSAKSAPSSTPEDLYSSVISAIADSGEIAPDVTVLRRIQSDLTALITASDRRAASCETEVKKLEKLNEAIVRERSKRSNKKPPKNRVSRAKEDAKDKPMKEVKAEVADPVEADEAESVEQEDQPEQETETGQETSDRDDDVEMNEAEDSEVQLESHVSDDDDKGQVTDLTEFQDELRHSGDESPKEFEKNPKSEFVDSQTLPIAALGLFQESTEDGLPQTGEEFLKKKYGVASYPTSDLTDMLPGEIPDEDFTRAKPNNQVQFTTFATAIEPFFRVYTEEDLSTLNQKAVGGDTTYTRPGLMSPYVIPPLGPSYVQTWAEEDGPNPGYVLSGNGLSKSADPKYVKPLGSEDSITDTTLEDQVVSCGPLASRLLSALMSEPGERGSIGGDHNEESDSVNGIKEEKDDVTSSPIGNGTGGTGNTNGGVNLVDPSWRIGVVKSDFPSLEERLQKEFRYVGILDTHLLKSDAKKKEIYRLANPETAKKRPNSELDDEVEIDWINSREDDEVSHELRSLQKKLRTLTRINQATKRTLLPVVEEHMAFQEYSHILEDLDRQVDQAYTKRIRNPKNKKKKTATAAASSHHHAPSTPGASGVANGPPADQQKPGLRALLDKRSRWISKIGPVFRPAALMKRIPNESVFTDVQFDDDDDEGQEEEEEAYNDIGF